MKHAVFKDAMTIEEAVERTRKYPSLPYNDHSPVSKGPSTGIGELIEPVQVFDNVYWIGCAHVGGILIDTGEGYVLIDNGSSEEEAQYMIDSIRKLGLDETKIVLLMISHEHFDHYGGTEYFLAHACPDAKAAISRTGWNLLQTVPTEFAYVDPKPKHADILLEDGTCLKVGNTTIYTVFTPGHSPGCVSFIFNASWKGEELRVGMMGGSAVWPTLTEIRTYQNSVEYFRLYTDLAECNAFTAVHQRKEAIEAVRSAEEHHPWICAPEDYDRLYLQNYRNMAHNAARNREIPPYRMPNLMAEHSKIVEQEED